MAPVLSELDLRSAMIIELFGFLRTSLNSNEEQRQEKTADSKMVLHRLHDSA